jgi:hypothetical protein
MRWLKGVVCETHKTLIRIELENGRKVWATPHFKLGICEQVLVIWDYTNDCIGIITTKERWTGTETEQDKAEASSMVDDFLSPSDERFEGELDGLEIASNHIFENETEDNSISMVDVFPVPSHDEDVDLDSMVELRYDITN